MKSKSPFYVVQEFFSPLLCEQIVDGLSFIEPNLSKEDEPMLTIKNNEKFEKIIFHYIQKEMSNIEAYYPGFVYKGMKPVEFKWYPMGYMSQESIVCENSTFIEKKKVWLRNRDRDLTCVVFLSDFNSSVPFDSAYEVYGGKYEFSQYNFGLNAQRGTLVIYPSGPNFLNAVAPVEYGDLFLAKFHLAGKLPYVYQPSEFPGKVSDWFAPYV